MRKNLRKLTTALFMAASLVLTGCATTGMNGDMPDEMGANTEMMAPAMDKGMATMPVQGEEIMDKPMGESSTMKEAPAPMMNQGGEPMMK